MRKKIIISVVVIAVLAVALTSIKFYIFHKIRQQINAQSDALRAKGFTVTFDSLESNAFSSSVKVSNINIVFPQGKCTDSATQFTAQRLEIKGIKLLPVLLKKRLSIESIFVGRGFFRDAGFPNHQNKQNKDADKKEKLLEINISDLSARHMRFERADTGSCKIIQRGELDLKIHGLAVHHPTTKARSYDVDGLTIDDAVFSLPEKYYTVRMHQFTYDHNDASAKVDSLDLKPWYDKITFVQKTGVQTDRVQMKIASIEISDLKRLLSDTLHAGRIELSFNADVFRDKRQPGGKQKVKKLFSRMIHDIKYPLQIDSLMVSNSSVRYEEFPAEGTHSGHVVFTRMNASIGNFSTFSQAPMTMTAHARFMEAGNLNAFFTFPADPDKAYTIKGSLLNFNLPAINPMLIPAANAEIKKGHLRSMLFNLEYNDQRSDGQLIMNYGDLEVVSLLKNSKDKKEENKFITLILKSFVVKKDMDANKNKGTILFYRDQHKASFNFWWKSLLSGIKSVFNLDKIVDTHHAKKK